MLALNRAKTRFCMCYFFLRKANIPLPLSKFAKKYIIGPPYCTLYSVHCASSAHLTVHCTLYTHYSMCTRHSCSSCNLVMLPTDYRPEANDPTSLVAKDSLTGKLIALTAYIMCSCIKAFVIFSQAEISAWWQCSVSSGWSTASLFLLT